MKDPYSPLFQNLPAHNPPEGFMRALSARIERYKRRVARFELSVSCAAICTSLYALVELVRYANVQFSQSGFSAYFALAYSNSGFAIAHLNSVLLSLAESLPVMGTVSILTAVFALLVSLKIIATLIINKGRLLTGRHYLSSL